MRSAVPILFFLVLIQLLFAADSAVVDGGGIFAITTTEEEQTERWAGIVGWINTSSQLLNPDIPVGRVNTTDVNITSLYLNRTFMGNTVIFTRLDYRPARSQLSSPIPSDFNESGMFSNFSVFTGLNFSETIDSPSNTFCNPCVYTTCRLGGSTFSCPYITLKNNTPMGVLKFNNGTHIEPVLVGTIEPRVGYNGTIFDFEYIVPLNETYYAFVYDAVPPNVTIISPTATSYTTSDVRLEFNIADNYGAVSSCWYTLDAVTVSLPDCSITYTLTLTAGTHTLTLYANDSDGNIGSDSVTFTVSKGGGGGWELYVPAAKGRGTAEMLHLNLTILPENITLVNDYPSGAAKEFTLSSNAELRNISCKLHWEFENITTITLDRDSISETQNASGTIYVAVTPEIALAHGGTYNATLTCLGVYKDKLNISSSVMANAIIIRPELHARNETVSVYVNHTKNILLPIFNTGDADAVNISVRFRGPYAKWFDLQEVPAVIESGGLGIASFDVDVLQDVNGTYNITYEIYEFDKLMHSGVITVHVSKKSRLLPHEVEDASSVLCITIILIMMWLIAAILTLRKHLLMHRKEKSSYLEGALYAIILFLLFFMLAIVVAVLLM